MLTFTKDDKKNTYETILTDEQAKGYTLDKVFTDWTPNEYAAQKSLGLLRAESGNYITWDAVDGAIAYAVFYDNKFADMTTGTSYDATESDMSKYTVRAANSHGGFGEASGVENASGIDNVEAGEAVSTTYYSIDGTRVNSSYRGVVIEVSKMADGSKTVRKTIRK